MPDRTTAASLKGILCHPLFQLGLLALVFFCFSFLGNSLLWPARILLVTLAGALIVRAVGFSRKNPRRFAFALILIAFNWAVFELLFYAFDRIYLARHPVYGRGTHLTLTEEQLGRVERLMDTGGFYGFDEELGWSIRPSVDRGRYFSNSRGLRSDREFERRAPDGVRRVLCTGDSYTFCADVGNGETWQDFAESAGDEFEFINAGVSGYCLAQSYLRYRKYAPEFETDYVFIGYMTNNIQRTVNNFRPFLNHNTGYVSAKPFASLEAGKLVINPNPLNSQARYRELLTNTAGVIAELGEQDYYVQLRKNSKPLLPSGRLWEFLKGEFDADRHIRRVFAAGDVNRGTAGRQDDDYENGSYPLEVVSRLFDRFVADVEKSGAKPIILIFPNEGDIQIYNEGKPRAHATLIEYFDKADYEYIDMLDVFAETYGPRIPAEKMFVGLHYNPPTNRMLGKRFVEYLRAR